jgi:hypothetical protein
MGIESSDFDEGVDAGAPSASEKASEKAREEAASKALANIAKSRKDETKGRKAGSLLFGLLAKILRDPRFDPILDPVFSLLKLDIPSAPIIGLLSLVSAEAADAIRKEYDPKAGPVSEPPAEAEMADFNPANIRPDLRNRINEWIEDVFRISTIDPSSVLTEKFLLLVSGGKERKAFLETGTAILTFFFVSKNLRIPQSEAEALSGYLLSELQKRLSGLNLERIG